MATMNISLPDKMKQWVERRAETGRYANASDYVRDLIRRDQERVTNVAEPVYSEADVAGIRLGLADMAAGRVIPHEQAMDELDAIIEAAARRRSA